MQQKPNNSLNERMRWAIKSLHASGPSAWALSLSRSLVLSKTKHTHTNIHTQNLSPTDTEIFINSLINLNTNTLIGPVKEDGGGGWGKKKNERQKKKTKRSAGMKWSIYICSSYVAFTWRLNVKNHYPCLFTSALTSSYCSFQKQYTQDAAVQGE